MWVQVPPRLPGNFLGKNLLMSSLPPLMCGWFLFSPLKVDKIEKLLYRSTAGSSALDEGSYMEHCSSSLKWRRIEVAIGWLLLVTYVFVSYARNVHLDGELTQSEIIMHSIVPFLSLLLWIMMMMFAVISCLSLIIGVNDVAASFSWVPILVLPVMAGLSALAPLEASWTNADGFIASLYYLIMFGLAVATRITTYCAYRRTRFYP